MKARLEAARMAASNVVSHVSSSTTTSPIPLQAHSECIPMEQTLYTPLSNVQIPRTVEYTAHRIPQCNSQPVQQEPVNHPNQGYFMSYLREECPECIQLQKKYANLQEQVNTLEADLSHLREKYQKALKDLSNVENHPPAVENTDSYTPGKGYKIPKASFVIKEGLTQDEVGPGYTQFGGAGSNVMVDSKWLGLMKSKTKMAKPSHSIKKYIDGFFNPWDLQTVTVKSRETMTGDKKELFDALQFFASTELGLSATEFNRAVITKAGTCRRTMQEVYPEYAVPKKPKTKKQQMALEQESLSTMSR